MKRLLWRAEIFLQELLDLVGVSFHLTAVQQEGRLSTRSQVLQDVWLPKDGRKKQKVRHMEKRKVRQKEKRRFNWTETGKREEVTENTK